MIKTNHYQMINKITGFCIFIIVPPFLKIISFPWIKKLSLSVKFNCFNLKNIFVEPVIYPFILKLRISCKKYLMRTDYKTNSTVRLLTDVYKSIN